MRRVIPILVALAAAGCAPTLPGPQLVDPPPGLAYVPSHEAPRGEMAGHPAVFERFWSTMQPPFMSLSIVSFRSRMTRADLESWLQSARTKDLELQPVREARIDGQPSWTWVERGSGVTAVGALVPFDDETFRIRLSSSRAGLLDPDVLLDSVSSFRRDPGASLRWAVPLGAAVLVGLAIWAWRQRAPPPPPRVLSRPAAPPPSPLRTPPAGPATR